MKVDSIALSVTNLSFAYGSKQILQQVDLAVHDGELVGVVGPNGSGKSTLLRNISGVLRPDTGQIFVDGQDVRRLSREAMARRVAVVPQSPHLPPSFTAGEIVILGRTPHLRLLQGEGPKDLAIVRQAMERCDTWDLAHRHIDELSGGERQRVVIARALAQEPRLLLMDEPTSHLDLGHQVAIMELVSQLSREQGLAVLAVFHDLNLAAQYCHRLMIIQDGRGLATGSPAEVINAETLSLVYGTSVCVVPHPQNNIPVAIVTGGNKSKGANW